jgi:hypothetical protein
MRHPSTVDVITRNRDKGHVCAFGKRHENRFVPRSQEGLNNKNAGPGA